MSVQPISLNARATTGTPLAGSGREPAAESTAGDTQKNTAGSASTEASLQTRYTPSQQRRIAELVRVDAEVRAHERAHINVGRDLIISGPSYEYTYGPDGRQYAVAGEVGIDTSPEHAPQANIDKGRHIQATALAPADPSAQDYAVATTGKALEALGYSELRSQRAAEAAAAHSPVHAYATSGHVAPQVDVYA
ncbi:MAG: hypothetical protein KGL40_07790 [Rhodocyclaceae bacterium]|nr:hypothetical protein [Rhodocyclaceae bacterium]